MEILNDKEVILSKSKEELQQYAEDIYIYIVGLKVIRHGQNKILKEQDIILKNIELPDPKNEIFKSLINVINTQRDMIYELKFMKDAQDELGLLVEQDNAIKSILNNVNKKLKLGLEHEVGF